MTRWGFLSVLVVVIGAVAAIGIYTWGWREEGDVEPETIPPPPGLWRPEFAEVRLTHTRWAIRRQVNEAECLGLGEPHVTGTIWRYRRFDCKAEVWTGDEFRDVLVELRVGPDETPVIVPR